MPETANQCHRHRGLARRLGLLLVATALLSGCGLRYTVPQELLRRLPKSSRKSVFQARTVVTIAIDKKSTVRRQMESTRREIGRTEERIREADRRYERTPPEKRGALDLEVEMLEAKIGYLGERMDFMEDRVDVASEELWLAKARFELSKAKLVKKHSIAFGGEVEDFEGQVEDLEADVTGMRTDLDTREAELKQDEEDWLAVKNRYYAAIGETSRGWWTEQEQGGATTGSEQAMTPEEAEAEADKELKPVERVKKRQAGLATADWRFAAKLGNQFPFLFGEDEVELNILQLHLTLEGCYFVHNNLPLCIAFAPGIGQSLRKDEEDERLTILPFSIGVRYQDDEGIALPFVGLGLGIQAIQGDRETEDWGVTFQASLTGGLDIQIDPTWGMVLEGGVTYGQLKLVHGHETDRGQVLWQKTFNAIGAYLGAGVVARF